MPAKKIANSTPLGVTAVAAAEFRGCRAAVSMNRDRREQPLASPSTAKRVGLLAG
jgi:hypothetical protein